MSRQYVPAGDDGQLATLLAQRLDALEVRLDALTRDSESSRTAARSDIEALGRGLAALTATVRDLPARATTAGEPPDPGTRDWLTVADYATAAEWLTDLASWVDSVWPILDGRALPQCWPIHPRTVADLLVLQDVYQAAFAQESPVPAADLFTRWHPEASRRVRTDLGRCTSGTHVLRGDHHARVNPVAPSAVATWWTTDRTGTPPGVEEVA